MRIYNEFSGSQLDSAQAVPLFDSIRRPVQCEGAERGHRRTAEVGSFASVSPQQFSFGSSLGLISNILPMSGLF